MWWPNATRAAPPCSGCCAGRRSPPAASSRFMARSQRVRRAKRIGGRHAARGAGRAIADAARHPARARRRRNAQRADLRSDRRRRAVVRRPTSSRSTSTRQQRQIIVDITTGAARSPELRHQRELSADRPRHRQGGRERPTFARVSYNIPGQQQRFAGERGLRDAENRAAKVIADNIRKRLASYFAAGT